MQYYLRVVLFYLFILCSPVLVLAEDISDADNLNQEISEKININTADHETLMQLEGVGEKRANFIINYRKKNGPYKTIEDLKKIKGIGGFFIDKNRDFITVGQPE